MQNNNFDVQIKINNNKIIYSTLPVMQSKKETVLKYNN